MNAQPSAIIYGEIHSRQYGLSIRYWFSARHDGFVIDWSSANPGEAVHNLLIMQRKEQDWVIGDHVGNEGPGMPNGALPPKGLQALMLREYAWLTRSRKQNLGTDLAS
jgi:hypothetical protein